MKINEAASLAGVSVRTLQYYDKIGLLHPSKNEDSGYRIYHKDDLDKLQQILFLRELDFSLLQIKSIIESPNYDKNKALLQQKELLVQKQKRLNGLINLIDTIIKGDDTMSFKEFDMSEIEKNKKLYAAEIRERWGGTDAYEESLKKTSSYDKAQWEKIQSESAFIISSFSEIKEMDPGCSKAQELVDRWKNHISQYYYNCTNEILSGLSLMYTDDERFRKNIDQYGKGTAAFMSEAIARYCSK